MNATEESPSAGRARLAQASGRAWRYAAILALAGLACAVLLGALSAWFLAAVALAGMSTATALAFNFHIPGALVRLFAIGRTAARYGERLAGHGAALGDQVLRRGDLFSAMARAPSVRAAGWQLGDQARLADYLDDVEDLDFGRLRATLPAMTVALGLAVGLIATLIVAPPAAIAILLVAGAWAVAAARFLRTAPDALDRARADARGGAGEFGAALASAVPLRAEGRWDDALEPALARFDAADADRLRLRKEQAGLDAIASLAGPVAGASVVAAAWIGGARGEALLVPIFVAFGWLALSETLQGPSRLVVAALRRGLARREIERWLSSGTDAAPAPAAGVVAQLRAPSLQRRAPDGRPLGAPVALDLRRGTPTMLVGVSGSGKTSLLKQIAGWIGDDIMEADGPLTAAQRRGIAMVCPHDTAILADTVRVNLFAPYAGDDELGRALEAVEMTGRVRQAGGLDGWIVQEALSLGEAQRLNLARAFLSAKPVILLDEPAEHLDTAQAARILERLLTRLSDRIVVMASHRPPERAGIRIVDLDATAA